MIPRLPHGFSHPMLIGEGGFSSVYRVRQIALDRWVALKIIHEHDPHKRQELLREAKIQAGIKAVCIPQIYDSFEKHGSVFIVMEWIRGISLAAMLENSSVDELSLEHRFWITEGILRALAELHTLKFAHRDLKPANIIISPENGIYLVDFGLSKMVFGSDARTVTGVVKGTPAYMAPELWQKKDSIDYLCADVYSVGKILRQVLPSDSGARITSALLEDDPSLRIKDGGAALDLWQKITGEQKTLPHWGKIASQLNSELLAKRLFLSAKELLYASREDEAYWLLVECLEQNPNHADALSLMNSFPEHLRRRRIRRMIGTALISSIILLLFCVIIMFSSFFDSQVFRHYSEPSLPKMPKLDFRKYGFLNHLEIPFRQDVSSSRNLCGKVKFVLIPDSGKLYIDGRVQPDTFIVSKVVDLDYGVHSVIWVNPDGSILWKEHVRLLPFQIRQISILNQ